MRNFVGSIGHVVKNDTRYYAREAWKQKVEIAVTLILAGWVLAMPLVAMWKGGI